MTQAPARAESRRSAPGLRARLFPGDRRIWSCAGVVLALGALAILVWLLVPRDYYTGTNNVRTRDFVVDLQRGDRLCVPGVQVPADTGRIQMEIHSGTGPRPRLDAVVTGAGGRTLVQSSVPAGPPLRGKVDFAIPKQSRAVAGTLCVTPGGPVEFGGTIGAADDRPVSVNGRSGDRRVAIWYLPPAGDQRSLLSHAGEILDRASLLRPAWVGPWTYVLLLLVVMPLLAYAAVRLLARAGDVEPRALAVRIALIGLANACVWALMTVPFNAPDESEHFAYVQYFAETGKTTQRQGATPPRPVYSTEEGLAIEAVRILSWNETPDGRPPWTEASERRWRERQAELGDVPRDNGGGGTAATWAHSPLYYATLAPGYFAGSGGSVWDQLTFARFLSAIYAAIVALCAFFIVRELLPSRPLFAAAAGLLTAFHPMLNFIGGAVNNDNGVNALAAVVCALVVRALRRGLTVRSAVALGAAVAVLPIMKGTGLAFYPLLALVGIALLIKRHSRDDLKAYAGAVAGFAALVLAWSALSGLFDQSTVTTPGGTAPASTASGNPFGYLSYLWQVFLPPLPFMTDLFVQKWPFFDIYIERGWAAFGWYAVQFPTWVYAVILLVTAGVGALGARLALRNLGWLKRHWLEVGFVVLVPVTVLAAVEAAYYTPAARPVLAEFGRYLFPAVACLAAIAAASTLGAGRRWATAVATTLVALVVVLNYASQFLMLAGTYT